MMHFESVKELEKGKPKRSRWPQLNISIHFESSCAAFILAYVLTPEGWEMLLCGTWKMPEGRWGRGRGSEEGNGVTLCSVVHCCSSGSPHCTQGLPTDRGLMGLAPHACSCDHTGQYAAAAFSIWSGGSPGGLWRGSQRENIWTLTCWRVTGGITFCSFISTRLILNPVGLFSFCFHQIFISFQNKRP